MRRAFLALPILLAPAIAGAQSAGGVPPYVQPPPVTIQRDGQDVRDMAPMAPPRITPVAESEVSGFASAYARNGKPRLALYWNRQLSETLAEWYTDARVVHGGMSSTTMTGDFDLNRTTQRRDTMELQSRRSDPGRPPVGESFEWEFQDGFLAPFMEAGAQIIDRAAIIRLTGADMEGSGERVVEMKALQGKADLLLEILVASNARSTTGYELRARVLEVGTGRIVAMVNSKRLKSWNPEKPIVATDKGFVDPEDVDDESFGPEGDERLRATPTGFERRRKPPKPDKIGNDLALNVMNGLMKQWK